MQTLHPHHPLADTLRDYRLWLRAAGKSLKTQRTYLDAASWLLAREEATTKTAVRSHMAYLNEHYSPGYASNQYRALRSFFAFLAEENGTPSVMDGMKPPRIPEKLVPVIPPADVKKLLTACAGKGFTDTRDAAIIRLFASSGARRAEIAGLETAHVDLDQLCAVVTGKAGKMRVIRFDAETGLAISRYLRARRKHRHAGSVMLWLGQSGPLLPDGIYQMFTRRCGKAGVKINPHRFRHDFSHRWLANGGNEGDLMSQNGWSSPAMLRRYGASAAAERARAAYDRVMGTHSA